MSEFLLSICWKQQQVNVETLYFVISKTLYNHMWMRVSVCGDTLWHIVTQPQISNTDTIGRKHYTQFHTIKSN